MPMYFTLVGRGEMVCYFNLGGGTDINLIERWGVNNFHIHLLLRESVIVSTIVDLRHFYNIPLWQELIWKRTAIKVCMHGISRRNMIDILALLTIISKNFSDWGTNCVCLSVCPLRLSYLKRHVLEFGVNHIKDALRCENLIEVRGSDFFHIIKN